MSVRFCPGQQVMEIQDGGQLTVGEVQMSVRVLGEWSDQPCPVCHVPLMPAAVAKIHILYCTQCRGMLIPMQVFEILVDELRISPDSKLVQPLVDSKDLSRKIDCPHCHRRMDAHFYAGPGNVVIDSCEECLLNWLDHGELARIARGADDRRPANVFYSEDSAPIQVKSWRELFSR